MSVDQLFWSAIDGLLFTKKNVPRHSATYSGRQAGRQSGRRGSKVLCGRHGATHGGRLADRQVRDKVGDTMRNTVANKFGDKWKTQ